MLNEIGITLPEISIRQAIENEAKNFDNNKAANFRKNTIVYKTISEIIFMVNALRNVSKNGEFVDVYSVFKEKPNYNQISIKPKYQTILNFFEPFLESVVEASSYENGKSHYAFNPPSYAGKLFINLKNAKDNPATFRNFCKREYDRIDWFNANVDYPKEIPSYLCPILNMITEDENGHDSWLAKSSKNWLDYKTQLSYRKTPYVELSGVTYMHSILTEFAYSEASEDPVVKAWYRMPIESNKPASEFVAMPRFKNYGDNGKEGEQKQEIYKDKITDYFFMVFQQELMRMRTILERAINDNVKPIKNYDISNISDELKNKIKRVKENGDVAFGSLTKEDLKSFSKSGASFKFLTFLNNTDNTDVSNYIIDYLNGKIKSNDYEVLDKIRNSFGITVSTEMKKLVEAQKKYMESIGIYDKAKTYDGKEYYKYFTELGLPIDMKLDEQKTKIDRFLENFVWNDMLACISTIELTVTDLAYYKNMEDFQKRFAQVHAPGLRLNTTAQNMINGKMQRVSDGYARTTYLKDYVLDTNIENIVYESFSKLIDRAKEPERKKALETMRDVVKAALKGVNVADAQAYTSPTGMMKKLTMAGSWTNDMQEAYGRICKGDFNLEDLQVFIQPLKPFVYSQIKKNSYANTMHTLKVGLQNKNSEYMILLVDALARGANVNNKLMALFDFMEGTHYNDREIVRNLNGKLKAIKFQKNKNGKLSVIVRNIEEIEDYNDKKEYKDGEVLNEGTYNTQDNGTGGRGIDTIQFESAVKVGSEGVINLNNLKYEDILNTLTQTVSSSIDGVEYDDRYVHTYSYEDYAIQQEVPAHLKDHTQPLGSQERILAISDMPFNTMLYFDQPDGTKIEKSAGDVIKRYQELIAANIQDSFDLLSEKLGLNVTEKSERNRIMSKLLRDEIRKDARYGADLYRACMLDDGNFVIPLSDPIQTTRIQQLIHSIIKRNINKQEMAGGPVVQTSCWGMSSNLKIRFKKDGSLDYFECAMPVPTKDLEEELVSLAKIIDGSSYNGRLATPDEAIEYGLISKEQLQAIGYRIPTEDKYSIYPMKIKNWVPRAAGEVIILPEEITKLTGSDFDIDKTYIILKEFYKSNKRKVKNSRRDDIIKRIKLKIKGLTDEQAEELLNKWEENSGQAVLGSDSYFNIINSIIFSERNVLLPKYRREHKNDRAGRNNEIFDIQWAMLTHQNTVDKMFNPGSFDPQKKASLIVRCLKNASNKLNYQELNKKSLDELEDYLKSISIGEELNILNVATQVRFFEQNMTAGKLIGMFANNNVSHAFGQMHNVKVNPTEEEKATEGIRMIFPERLNMYFAGVNLIGSKRIDDIYALDKATYISKNIAGFLAASVDAVKDPVLNYLNLNTFTTGVAMVLARLGFDVNSISLFLSQPILEEASRQYANENVEGYKSAADVVGDMLKKMKGSEWKKSLQDCSSADKLTIEKMAENLQSPKSSTNFEVLRMFYNLLDYSQALSDLTYLTKFNSISNAAGPTIADSIIMERRVSRFYESFNEKEPIFNEETSDILKESPILNAFYKATVDSENGAVRKAFEPWFIQYTNVFSRLIEAWENVTKTPLDEKTINQLTQEFLLYKLTYGDEEFDTFFDTSVEKRNYYINDFPKHFWSTISENPELLQNKLISIVKPKTKNKKCPVDTLEVNVGSFASDTQEDVKDAWSELLTSKNEEYRKLGRDLFYYCLFRNGFSFSPKTFIHLASVDTKLAMGYTERLLDDKENKFNVKFNKSVNILDFIEQFKRNHSSNKRVVPEFKQEDMPAYKIEDDILYIRGDNETLKQFKAGENGTISMFTFNKKLYKLVEGAGSMKEGILLYTETTPLGNNNNFLEYRAKRVDEFEFNSVISDKGVSDLDDSQDSIDDEKPNTPETSQKTNEPVPEGRNNQSGTVQVTITGGDESFDNAAKLLTDDSEAIKKSKQIGDKICHTNSPKE